MQEYRLIFSICGKVGKSECEGEIHVYLSAWFLPVVKRIEVIA